MRTLIVCASLTTSLWSAGCAHDDTASTRDARQASTRGSERSPSHARVGDANEARVDARVDAPPPGTDGRGHSSAERVAADPWTDAHVTPVPPPTAQDQSERPTDLEITRSIRRAVVNDGSLSFMAQNATIVTEDGIVTLRGNVNTRAERGALERHARAVSGVTRVNDLVAVRP